MTPPIQYLAVLAAVTSGTTGGVFFAFSTFVMHGLDRLPPAEAVAAMQAINSSAVRPAFMTAMFGTACGSVLLGVHGARHPAHPASRLLLAGAGLYLVGVIGLTIGRHVPLNDALAALHTENTRGNAWTAYRDNWTRWNHVRAGAAILASAAYAVAAAPRG